MWSILTELAAYPTWNPFIRRASGEVQEGALLSVTVAPPGRDELSFEPTVLAVRPNLGISSCAGAENYGSRGLFHGEHAFAIEPLGLLRRRR